MNVQRGAFYTAMLRSESHFSSFTFCTVVFGSAWDIWSFVQIVGESCMSVVLFSFL